MEESPLVCHRCFAELEPGKAELYVVRIVGFADPSGPVIDEEDMKRDLRREIE